MSIASVILALFHWLGGSRVNSDPSCRRSGAWARRFLCLDGASLHRHAVPQRRNCPVQSGRAIDDEELGPPQAAPDEIVEMARQASVVSPPMFLTASRTFWPSARTPMTTSSEIEVAFAVESDTNHVPSRTRRTIGWSASERAFQASQSVLTLRQMRLMS